MAVIPAEGLWPLTNEAVANGLFEETEKVEEALVERCEQLLEQTESIRELTSYHCIGGPRRHDVPSSIHPDSVLPVEGRSLFPSKAGGF